MTDSSGSFKEEFVKSNNDIPKNFIKKNNGNIPAIGSGDIPIQYLIYTYLSDKQMREDELLKIFEGKNKYLVYNALEQSDELIYELTDDSLIKNPFVSIFLVGDDKKSSAYATFSVRDSDASSDINSPGYSFLWFKDKDIEQKKKNTLLSPIIENVGMTFVFALHNMQLIMSPETTRLSLLKQDNLLWHK